MKFKPGDKFILELGKRKLNKYEIAGTDLYVLIEMLEKLTPYTPSEDTVEVVRCRDCKYFEPDGPYDGWCHGWSGMIVDDGYCSFGKASLDAEGDKWI